MASISIFEPNKTGFYIASNLLNSIISRPLFTQFFKFFTKICKNKSTSVVKIECHIFNVVWQKSISKLKCEMD